MQAAVSLGQTWDLSQWLKSRFEADPTNEDVYLADYLAAFGSGGEARLHAATTIMNTQKFGGWLQRDDGQPNAVGRFLLSLSDAELAAAGKKAEYRFHTLRFLSHHAVGRLASFADVFILETIHEPDMVSADSCRLLLEHDKNQFRALILGAVRQECDDIQKAFVWALLADHFPNEYTDEAKQANLALLRSDSIRAGWKVRSDAFRWLLRRFGSSLLPEIEGYLSHRTYPGLRENLIILAEELGEAAAPGLVAALGNRDHGIRLEALRN